MSDYLPQEILISILIRLPAKSLIKLRCVSKSWNSIISNPYFIALHARQATANNFIVRRSFSYEVAEMYTMHSADSEEFQEKDDIRIEYPFGGLHCRIVGSSNGVLCLSDDLIIGQNSSIFLWNPVIRRKITLPPPEATSESTQRHYICVLGFGFDAKNDDYKVVRLTYSRVHCGYLLNWLLPLSLPLPMVEVYALSTRCWRQISGRLPMNCMLDNFRTQAFVNGKVHWVSFYYNSREAKAENLKNVITVFDMSDEEIDELPLPDTLTNEMPDNLNAAVLGEALAIYQYDERFHSSSSIWVMNEYGDVESWSKQFHILLGGGLCMMIVGVRRNGDVLIPTGNHRLIAYNPETKSRTELGIFGASKSFYACSHVESLALLNEGEEAREKPPYGRAGNGELWKLSSVLNYLTSMVEGFYVYFLSKL